MRTIDIQHSPVEVWPGPRIILHTPDTFTAVKLPTGCVTMTVNARTGSLAFGTANATSVIVTGPVARIRALRDMLYEMLAPSTGEAKRDLP